MKKYISKRFPIIGMLVVTALCSAVLLVLLALPVRAQTPVAGSGINQGICDVLNAKGVTPGLYGLCVAHCEALDCPDPGSISPDPDKVATRQCRVASPKILDRYNHLKKDTDPGMPCVRPTCACWKPAELATVTTTYLPHYVWRTMTSDSTGMTDDLEEMAYPTPTTMGWTEASVVSQTTDTTTYSCQYVNVLIDLATGFFSGTINSQPITAPQAEVCRTELDAYGADLLYKGVSIPCYGTLCP